MENAATRMITAVRAYVSRSLTDIVKRLDGIESKIVAPQRGEKGEPGAAGKDADPQAIRDEVARAVAGLPKAKDGLPGRDATHIYPVPLDESRSYPAGTWARYAGGLLYAERSTEPVTEGLHQAGWAVVMEGVAGIVVTQSDDLRTILVASMLTSGTKMVSEFSLPVMIYRGIWKEGEYSVGDVVTYAGSTWHCQEKTTGKPGMTDSFKLMVKRGADAKPGPVKL